MIDEDVSTYTYTDNSQKCWEDSQCKFPRKCIEGACRQNDGAEVTVPRPTSPPNPPDDSSSSSSGGKSSSSDYDSSDGGGGEGIGGMIVVGGFLVMPNGNSKN